MALAVIVIAAAAVVAGVLLVVRSLGTDTHGAHVVRFTLESPLVHQTLPVAAVVPAGASAGPRPLLVFLHGKGQDENSNLDDAMFAALARLGSRAPDVVFPYAGADSYWHNRAGAARDFALNDVIRVAQRGDPYRGMAVWIDARLLCGRARGLSRLTHDLDGGVAS